MFCRQKYDCVLANLFSIFFCFGMKISREGWLGVCFINLDCYYFHFLTSAATGAEAPDCSSTVNAAD